MNKKLCVFKRYKTSICVLFHNFQFEACPVTETEEQDGRQTEDQRCGDHVHLGQDHHAGDAGDAGRDVGDVDGDDVMQTW